MYQVDSSLIRQVQFRSNGLSVHQVNEAITNYKMSVSVANGTAWWIQEYNPEKKNKVILLGRTRMIEWEAYLRSFVSTGIFNKDLKPKLYI